MNVRPVRLDDLVDISIIEYNLYGGDAYSIEKYKKYVKSKNCHFFMLNDDKKNIIGYGQVVYRKDTKTGYIYGITVDTPFQGNGYGKEILALCERHIKDRGRITAHLEVRKDNKKAIGLYTKSGYKFIRNKENYYFDGCTALVYKKKL